MLVYWKGRVKPIVSDELVSQLDLYASIANLIDAEVPDGLDSQDQMDAFLGEGKGRESLIVEAKSRLALRSGDYTLIPPYNGVSFWKNKKVELGNSHDYLCTI